MAYASPVINKEPSGTEKSWLCGPIVQSFVCFLWIPYQLQIIYLLVIGLSVLCLVPCPVFVWGPHGLLATDSCYWVGWGLCSLNAAFPWWSCLSYFLSPVWIIGHWLPLVVYLKRHASRFMLIFMKILKMCLKVLFSEITKRKQFKQHQWHLQPT
jgi:hypothetical protein